MVGLLGLLDRWGSSILQEVKQGPLTILRILGLMVSPRLFLPRSGLGMTIMRL